MVFTDELIISKFVFYVVLFELMVKISFATIIGSYQSSDAFRKQISKVSRCRLRGSANV